MFSISSESIFIKLLTTSKMFLTWLNINLELLKIGCNQTTKLSRQRHMPRMVATSGKSSASLNNKGGWADRWVWVGSTWWPMAWHGVL